MRFVTRRKIKNWLILISVLIIILFLADKYLCCYDKIESRYDTGMISNIIFSPDSSRIAFVSGAYYYRAAKGFMLFLAPYDIKECTSKAYVYSYDLKTKKLEPIQSIDLDKNTLISDLIPVSWDNAGVLINRAGEYIYVDQSGVKKMIEPNLDRIRNHERQYRYTYQHQGKGIQRLVSPDRKAFIETDNGKYFYFRSEEEIPIRPAEIYELPENETELRMLIEDNPEILIQQEFENVAFIAERQELNMELGLPDLDEMKEKHDYVLFGLTC